MSELLQAMASELVAQRGRRIAIRRKTTLADPLAPHDPSAGSETETDYPVSAVFLDSQEDRFNGALVESGDRVVLLAAVDLPITPRTSDKLIDEDTTYAIVAVNTVRPGNISINHELLVRG